MFFRSKVWPPFFWSKFDVWQEFFHGQKTPQQLERVFFFRNFLIKHLLKVQRSLKTYCFHQRLSFKKGFLIIQSWGKWFSSWWFQRMWQICASNWIISPWIGVKKKSLKPTPIVLTVALTSKDFRFPSISVFQSMETTPAHLELEFVEAQAPSAVVEWGGVLVKCST